MIDLVYNDLSAQPFCASYQNTLERIRVLLHTIGCARDFGLSGSLRVRSDFHESLVDIDYTINNWIGDHRTPRDERALLLQLTTKSPLLPDERPQVDEEIDIYVGASNSEAYRAAYLLDFPLLSFCHSEWDVPALHSKLARLLENDAIEESDIEIPNIAQASHFEANRDWIIERSKRSIQKMSELWERRAELFPNLQFSVSVEAQLLSINGSDEHFHQVIKRLFELQAYFMRWEKGPFAPGELSRCSPTSAVTLDRYRTNYTHRFSGDQAILCDWHVYLTPGAWRIYFSANGQTREGFIGHIGPKLPDVTYGTN